MKTKYIVKRKGFVVINGSPIELRVGQSVNQLIYRNYPNFVSAVEIEEAVIVPEKEKELLIEQPIEAINFVEEDIVDEGYNESETEEDEKDEKPKKRGKKSKKK